MRLAPVLLVVALGAGACADGAGTAAGGGRPLAPLVVAPPGPGWQADGPAVEVDEGNRGEVFGLGEQAEEANAAARAAGVEETLYRSWARGEQFAFTVVLRYRGAPAGLGDPATGALRDLADLPDGLTGSCLRTAGDGSAFETCTVSAPDDRLDVQVSVVGPDGPDVPQAAEAWARAAAERLTAR